MNINNLSQIFLRVGLAFVFTFASIEIFINPDSLIGYTPGFMFQFIPQDLFMYSFAIFEVALALWLLSGKKLLIPSIVAAIAMCMIVIFNIDKFSVLFRNIAIMCAALSLASMNWKQVVLKKENTIPTQPTGTQSPIPAPAQKQAVAPNPQKR